ncbi:hypothetical protein JCM10212_007013 [Sporobolomyces blumeae]
MESLGQLNGALPPPQGEDLQKAFRHAALSITTMYQASKKASATAYLAGKKEALQDVLEFLQASLDHPQPSSSVSGPLSVGRLIDYICARQEALKAEEEDNDDEETAPPRRPASASQAPPSPHRPGPFQARESTPSISSLSATSAPISRANSSQPRQAAPVASTSSAPASPSFSPTSSRINTLSRPNPFPFPQPHGPPLPSAVSASPSPLSSTVQLPLSPLGRSATPLHGRSHRSRTSSRGKGVASTPGSGQATPIPLGPAGVEAAELGAEGVGHGMKRRWGIRAAPTDDVVDVDLGQGRDAQGSGETEGGGRTGTDGMEMDMEGWDGIGERPLKRVARSMRRDLTEGGDEVRERPDDEEGGGRGQVTRG